MDHHRHHHYHPAELEGTIPYQQGTVKNHTPNQKSKRLSYCMHCNVEASWKCDDWGHVKYTQLHLRPAPHSMSMNDVWILFAKAAFYVHHSGSPDPLTSFLMLSSVTTQQQSWFAENVLQGCWCGIRCKDKVQVEHKNQLSKLTEYTLTFCLFYNPTLGNRIFTSD